LSIVQQRNNTNPSVTAVKTVNENNEVPAKVVAMLTQPIKIDKGFPQNPRTLQRK
jgi:hypothetical protein